MNMTEADEPRARANCPVGFPRGAGAASCGAGPKEVSSCERPRRGCCRGAGFPGEFASCRARASRLALAPVRGGVPGCVFPVGDPAGRTASRIRRNEGHLVDALALRGDEGRGTLRKARGRCERSLIPGSPNGATHPAQGKLWRVSLSESIGQGGEPGELKHLSSRRNGHQPRLRE